MKSVPPGPGRLRTQEIKYDILTTEALFSNKLDKAAYDKYVKCSWYTYHFLTWGQTVSYIPLVSSPLGDLDNVGLPGNGRPSIHKNDKSLIIKFWIRTYYAIFKYHNW
jgi:hypothetical protein